jgi:hypothetical protein
MSARTKIRLLMLPQLVATLALLAFIWFVPRNSSFFIFIDLAFVALFTANLIWWVKKGLPIHTRLVNQMKAEESPLPTRESRTVEDRLDELERHKRRNMVTPEEYAAKRQDILKDL